VHKKEIAREGGIDEIGTRWREKGKKNKETLKWTLCVKNSIG
jgi:hypothetical protein